MRHLLAMAFLFTSSITITAQTDSGSKFWKPTPRNYELKHALELEAVPFVYLSEGYHLSVGYRYRKFRFRLSTIDAGTFNSEMSNSAFERFETNGSFGFFAGYSVWRNLETYIFMDRQVFDIRQKSTSEIKQVKAVSPGLGIGYQFFIGRFFYIQPALHLYVRGSKDVMFSDNSKYSLSTVEFFPVLRLGVRPWKKFN